MTAPIGRAVTNQLLTVAATTFMGPTTMSVPITATLLPAGPVTAPHIAWFHNMDATNFFKVRNGTSGADVLKFKAGERFWVPLLDTGTYWVIADTGVVAIEYMLIGL